MKGRSDERREKELPACLRNTRLEIIDLIPASAQRVLEIGCAAGEMGRALREQRPEVEVVGVEISPEAAQLAGEKLSRVICGNIEELEFLPYAEGYFDCITCGELLEHLRDPEAVLRKLLFYLQPEGALICSIPNIRHQSVMLELMINGRWQYRDEGLLDRTHIRFFTLFEIRELMSRLDLNLEQVSASQSPPMKEMEPFFQAVAELGGDVEALRQESRIIQYTFRAVCQKSREIRPIAEDDPRGSAVIPVFNAAATNVPRIFTGNWEGSFFLHSSLAHVNREMVLALLASGRCELGLIPFEANQFGVEEDPERFGVIAERLEKPLREGVDFHLRHRWPPDFSRPPAGRLILIQPWEFGRIPQSWVQPLRDGVDQIWAYSEYVRSCYVDSGIEPDRIRVVPLGVDVERFKPGLEPLLLPTEKRFKFLFVGGTLYRKGIDVLLEAYRTCFAADDDVCLVIKDMGTQTFYRNQNAGEQIRSLQEDPACAEIVYLTEDMAGDQIPRLYAACDCLVHPYRGEGFGLPVAEAMACGMPVVVTAGGACDDFCSNETAFMIPALRRQVRFQEETVGAAWLLEPDLEILRQQVLLVVGDLPGAKRRGERAAAFVRQHLTWERTAARALEVLEELCAQEEERSAPDISSLLPGASAGRETAAVVLGGGESGTVVGLADFLGEEPVRYDLELSAERFLGEQLEAIRGDWQGEFLAILGKGAICSAATFGQLVDTLQSREDIAAIGPGLPGEEGGSGVAVVESLPPDCILFRRTALEAIGGFAGVFRTTAVFDEVARCCRQRGWQVAKAFDCVLEQQGEAVEDEVATRRERRAVQALEEGDRRKAEQDWEGAEQAYRQALESKEDFVESIMVLAALLMERGRGAEAVEVVERLVHLNEASYLAHNYLGLAQHQVEDWDGARRSFSRALELQPDYVEALVNLSVLEWGQEDADLALDYLERAAELEPDNRDVIVNIGLIYAEVGNADMALKLFREYVQYHPEDVEVMTFLVDLLMQNEEMEEARQVARRILEVQPQHAKARAIVESSRG